MDLPPLDNGLLWLDDPFVDYAVFGPPYPPPILADLPPPCDGLINLDVLSPCEKLDLFGYSCLNPLLPSGGVGGGGGYGGWFSDLSHRITVATALTATAGVAAIADTVGGTAGTAGTSGTVHDPMFNTTQPDYWFRREQ